MNVIQIIKEEIGAALFEGMVWFHGTPDARELKQSGFESRTATTDYIPNPDEWNRLQDEMRKARANGGEDQYFKLLDMAGQQRKKLSYKKPVFFTNNRQVANTYTDAHRSFDYQNAEPKLIQAEIDDSGKVLKVPAQGQRFRMINADIVKQAFINAGIPEEVVNKYFAMFPTYIRNNKMSAETIGIIAQQLGFDIVDVLGVLDSYHGGSVQSNVRMVFDPQRIRIL